MKAKCFYQNEFLLIFGKVLKSFDVLKNTKNLYGLNAISQNLENDLFDNDLKLFWALPYYITTKRIANMVLNSKLLKLSKAKVVDRYQLSTTSEPVVRIKISRL